MRYLLLLCCWLGVLPLRADRLSNQLRQLLPGETTARVNQRQFLYQRFDALFERLVEEEKADRRSVKKRTKRIADHLRRRLFRTYDEGADLDDAFRSGNYNTATAAAITALTLRHFGVETNAFVDHWRVHLVADPGGKAIPLESSAGRRARPAQYRAYRREYLNLLRSTVLQEAPPLSAAAADRLFEQYYYAPERALSFGQLANYLQYRRALRAYDRKEYASALAAVDIALLSEDRPAFLLLQEAARLQLAALSRPDVAGDIDLLFAEWTEDPDNRYLPAAILNHFDDRQHLLIAREDTDAARALLQEYRDRAPSGKQDWSDQLTTLQDLRFLAHHQKAGRTAAAVEIAERLYLARPDAPAIRHLLGETLLGDLRSRSGDAADLVNRLETVADRYPFLRQQDRYADLLLRRQAIRVRDLFAAENETAALGALTQFREALLQIPIGNDRSLWTMTAFLAASTYYFHRADYGRARQYVDEALRYAPKDDYLLHRREVLSRY